MKYQAKEGFELKEIAGELLLLPRGASTVDYNYVMVFNETGALIYRALQNPSDVDSLAALLVEKYGISAEEAKADIEAYVAKMLDAEIVEVV